MDLVWKEAGGIWVCVHKHMRMVLIGWGFDSSGVYLYGDKENMFSLLPSGANEQWVGGRRRERICL